MRNMNYQQNNYQQQNNNQNYNQNYNNKTQNPHNQQNRMMKIYLYYKSGTKNGRRYRVPHTISFGFDMTVSLNGNSGNMVQYDPSVDSDYIIYDPTKCGVSVNKSGYLTLQITD